MADIIARYGLPYIWPTWLAGLLSGDRSCWWAAWFKAHHREYPRMENRNPARLSLWRAEHASMVAATAERMRNDGYLVTVEDQTKILVVGQSAIVGGRPDIVAVPVESDHSAHIVDCKTGKRRESDFWQVVTYGAALTLPRAKFANQQVSGSVAYKDSVRTVSVDDVRGGTPLVFRAIRRVAGQEPARAPSVTECRDCDIACCPDRAMEAEDAVETEEF